MKKVEKIDKDETSGLKSERKKMFWNLKGISSTPVNYDKMMRRRHKDDEIM